MISILALVCITHQAAVPIKIACVGDSITVGVGTSDPGTKSYPAQLQRILGAKYEVRNFGRSATTLARTASLPYWGVEEFKTAQDFQPKIVVIKLGTNDASQQNWHRSKDVFVPQYKELIAVFRALPSRPKVYVCLPVPAYEERQVNIDTAVVPLVKQLARETSTPLIDLYAALEGRPNLLPDKLHPNDEGAALMAAAVAEAIEEPVEKKKSWRVVSVDSEETGEGPARNAVDGDTYTYWHTNYSAKETRPPHELVVDMGASATISALRHLPRQDGGVNGRVKGFELYLSDDGKAWGTPALIGEIKNTAAWSAWSLPQPVKARYFKFRALSEWNGGPWTSVGELDVRFTPGQ